MGEMADYYMDRAMSEEAEYQIHVTRVQRLIDSRAKKGYWVTQSGEKISFRDMEISHAKNIVKYFAKHHPELSIPKQIINLTKGN